METREITVTLKKAIEWYNSGNKELQKIALKAFGEDKLINNFRYITTFEKACGVLSLNYNSVLSIVKSVAIVSKASAAMFKLSIIRKALNLGQDLHLTKDSNDSHIYYPYNPFVTKSSTYYKTELGIGEMEIIGKIQSEGEIYNVLGGAVYYSGLTGLGYFNSHVGVGDAIADIGFLGCASEEIAQHFGKYFGMLITEAKYGDMVDFEIINEK